MISVDTNVIVRLLTADDRVQYKAAKAVFERETVFIATTVLLETEWVLRNAYGFEPSAIRKAFSDMCGLANVVIPDPDRMIAAIQWYSEGMDFADAIHLAGSQECRNFLTFDRKLIRKATGRGECRVREP